MHKSRIKHNLHKRIDTMYKCNLITVPRTVTSILSPLTFFSDFPIKFCVATMYFAIRFSKIWYLFSRFVDSSLTGYKYAHRLCLCLIFFSGFISGYFCLHTITTHICIMYIRSVKLHSHSNYCTFRLQYGTLQCCMHNTLQCDNLSNIHNFY